MNYEEALNVMFWDLRTGAPKDGVEQRSEVISQLSTDVFNMSVSDEMAGYLEKLEHLAAEGKLSEKDAKNSRRVPQRI
ncbi:hypothetical protein GCM10020331_066820 [Ectobacillus funiculus]